MSALADTAMHPHPLRTRNGPNRTLWRMGVGLGGLLVLAGLCLGVVEMLRDPDRFPVENVDVLGNLDYTDRAMLSDRVAKYFRKGLLAVNIDAVRADVESLPWVADAQVSRIWPGRLGISIKEHEAAARWNEFGLVSKQHVLFFPPQLQADNPRLGQWQSVFSPLPRLEGAEGRHAAVLDDYRRYQQKLAPLGLVIEDLIEDDRRSQLLELENNVTVRLGYEERDERLARFYDVYPQLSERITGQPVRFDMRYRNGFALAGVRQGPGVL